MFKGKRSFFIELLISFLLLLCIPIITILLILWQSNKVVKEQIMDIENKNLSLYVEQLEEVMEEMKEICSTVFATEECRLYAANSANNTKLDKELRAKIHNLLENQLDSKYYDVFIWYNRNNKVISGKAVVMDIANYYATYYSNYIIEDEATDTFLSILKTDTKGLVCHIINNGEDKQFLCMTMGKHESRNPLADYTVCIVLDPTYLEQLLVMQNEYPDSVLQVYNSEKELLISNNSKLDWQYMIEPMAWEEGVRSVWLDRKDYMIQIRESLILGNSYVYVVSKEVFWSTLRWLRICGFVGAGLCVLISIIFAYRSAARAYRPVGNIMEFLERKKGNTSPESVKSEFLHIMSFVENQEKALKGKNKISREWFLHGLLEDKYEYVDEALLEENKVSFNNERFVVCIIHVDILNQEMEDLCGFVVQNVLGELCNMVGKAYFVGLSKNRYALLINTSGEDSELYKVLQEGQEFLLQKFQIVLTIGYSDSHEGIHSIPEAYKEAQETIRYRFLFGSGKIICYKDIKARNASYRNDEESKVFMLLLEYIENRKEEDDLDNFVDQLMYVYQMNEEMSMDVALVFKNEIISALGRVMKLCGYEEESIREARRSLKNATTLSDFQHQLSDQITELCKCKIKRKSNDDVLEELKQLINESYNDTELSITMLGNQIGMHPTHMSKIFKEKYGVSILDYIASVRISHAKRIIREEGSTIRETGEKTGFLSNEVFIRTFKKKEGITPGKYKEMIEREKME
ncbi:MAG: helix-turn-helix domain-containing protein [Lachnospiraceae bacterium]|nr:helix-turn-helix domain-containing protein [Lachnospiraceae bacterium]